jgi:hypothetical protein
VDFNDALHAYQNGKLSDYSIADLRILRQKCAEQVSQQGPIMRDVISLIDYHIDIKNAADTEVRENARHQALIAEQQGLRSVVDSVASVQSTMKRTVDQIHRLDVWILIAGAIAGLAGVILLVVEIVQLVCGGK